MVCSLVKWNVWTRTPLSLYSTDYDYGVFFGQM